MKKTLLFALILIGFGLASATAQEEAQMKTRQKPAEAEMRTRPQAEAPKATEKVQKASKTAFTPNVTGTVISLAKLAMGADPSVTKAEAEDLVKKGQPLALKAGEEIYLIYNAKNVFDGKSLAKFAEAKNLGVAGEVKYVNGFAVVIANKIQPVE